MGDKTKLKVFLMDDHEEEREYRSLLLRHPGTDETAMFLVANNEIYEVLNFNETYRSWFIDDRVASDGRLYIPVAMDPLYFVLNYFTKEPAKAIPLEQLLDDDLVNNNHQLLEVISLEQVRQIGDQKGPDDLKAFKYNEEKALEWLKKKCEQVVVALQNEDADPTDHNNDNEADDDGHVTSSSYVKVETGVERKKDESSHLITAHNILSAYLNPELTAKLAKHLNIDLEKKEQANVKRKSAVEIEVPDVKKLKLTGGGEATSQPKEDKRAAAKNKALAGAAKGTKSITSFFKKA